MSPPGKKSRRTLTRHTPGNPPKGDKQDDRKINTLRSAWQVGRRRR